MRKKLSVRLLTTVVILLLIQACSTVRHIPADELLYVGMDKVAVIDTLPSPSSRQAATEAIDVLSCAPNNAFFGSSRHRWPIPWGLWNYHAFYNDSVGLGHWMFRHFAKAPILVSAVDPEWRCEVASNTLRNHGFFDNRITYRVDTCKHRRKARIHYEVDMGPSWHYDSIAYVGFPSPMENILSAHPAGADLQQGAPFGYQSLADERLRLFHLFREQGYYYLRPDDITFRADTIGTPGLADLQVTPRKGIPAASLRPWFIGDTHFILRNVQGEVLTDSLLHDDVSYRYHGRHVPVHPSLLSSCLQQERGARFSVQGQESTSQSLSRLGVFNSVSMNYLPRSSDLSGDTLDLYITAQLEKPYEWSLEANITGKSNNQFGPEIVTTLSHKNLLHHCELIRYRLNGSYEWEMNPALRQQGEAVNSFEVGGEVSMSLPQLLFPGGSRAYRHAAVSTTARLYGNWLNRAGYFRMLSFGGDWEYAFSSSRLLTHTVTPFQLTFNSLEKTSVRFDSIMSANPALSLSFSNRFIPAMRYAFTWDNRPSGVRHGTVIDGSLTSSGNLTSLVYAAFGHSFRERDKKLFGTPFAQFVKATLQVRHYFALAPRHTLATRFYAGGAYAYGNSVVVPYTEQFHAGGSSDIRAFHLREIGPGSYRSSGKYGYLDQTGDLKFIANLEYRFPISGGFEGALFVDAGNVWQTRNSAARPEGQLTLRDLGRDIALGSGLGLRYNLGMVVLRCDIGVPIHVPYDTGRRGYYNVPHFGKGLCFHLAVGYPF